MARPASPQPTDGELEILKILWEIEPAGLGRIHAALRQKREVAMTTVATMLKTMRVKDLVDRDEGPRGYTYKAKVGRSAAATGMIGKLVDLVFDGSARNLVSHLVEDGKLSALERAEIAELLKQASAKKHSPRKKGEIK